MDATEKYHRKWIKAIAKKTSAREIKRHIIYHAHDLEDPTRNLASSWLASMHNLLKIYQEVHHISSSTPEQIYKLGNKYYKYKGWVGVPDGRIPDTVEMKWVSLGRKKRKGEKVVTIKELRGLGRNTEPLWARKVKK